MAVYKVTFEIRVGKPLPVKKGNREDQVRLIGLIQMGIRLAIERVFHETVQIANTKIEKVK
jgi:hypothetical protein